MKDFVAIDFETANGEASSVCSVGLVMVRGGRIVDSFYSLIHPEPDYYSWFCQRVHGLGPCDTDEAPVFPVVWTQALERIREVYADGLLPFCEPELVPFVAHNARFDEGCLRAVHRVYGMEWPGYRFRDTLQASRRHFGHQLPNHQLQTVAAACGYDLTRHHHALADAEACATIALYIL